LVASEFEYRHRFWMILLVYVAAYSFYNLDHLNILYSVVPWNQGVLQKDTLVRFLYAAAALVAAIGASLLTWSSAYRPPTAIKDRTALSVAGPFRYVRNPQYLSYFFLVLALGTFQSRLGFPVMLLAEMILLVRLVARGAPPRTGVRRAFSRLRAARSALSPLASSAVRRRRPVTAMAPSSLGPGLSMGLRRHTACLRMHPKRPNWVCLRFCDHCVLGASKACSSVLDSPAA